MKTIIATTIALAIATSAVASPLERTLRWDGSTSNDIHDAQCLFGTLSHGEMGVYNPNSKKWTTVQDATVSISARKVSNIKVEAQGQLRQGGTVTSINANIDYRDDWVVVNGANSNAVQATATNSPTNSAQITGGFSSTGSAYTNVNIKLGGTASISNSNDLTENTNYSIHHKITCTL
jgi:hypothetical protein